MNRILVIKLGAFGDILQSDGALRDIRAHHAQDEIVVLTTPPYARIFNRCPHVDRVIVEERFPRWRIDKLLELRNRLQQENFTLVYDLQNSDRTAFYFKWLLPNVIWSGTAPGCTLPHRAKNPKMIRTLDRLAGQLTDAGVPIHHTLKPDLRWMTDDVSQIMADAGLKEPFIVMIPGTSPRALQRRWGHYEELAEALMADGWNVVTAPGPDGTDPELPGFVLRGPKGFLNWFELAGLMSRAHFVIGNDTGPTHLASHLGCQGLALYGSHMPAERTGVIRANFAAIQVNHLKDLTLEHVLADVRQRLTQ
jgi:ADP-heptose:LPS heptosyltransferase